MSSSIKISSYILYSFFFTVDYLCLSRSSNHFNPIISISTEERKMKIYYFIIIHSILFIAVDYLSPYWWRLLMFLFSISFHKVNTFLASYHKILLRDYLMNRTKQKFSLGFQKKMMIHVHKSYLCLSSVWYALTDWDISQFH